MAGSKALTKPDMTGLTPHTNVLISMPAPITGVPTVMVIGHSRSSKTDHSLPRIRSEQLRYYFFSFTTSYFTFSPSTITRI